jgi:lipoprotein Spr
LNFFKSFIIFTFFLFGFTIIVKAQTSHKNKQPRFIEGIEINRNVNSRTTILDENWNLRKKSNPEILDASSNVDIEHFKSIQFKYAQLLNVEIEKINNTALYDFIDNWYATRYRFGGCSKSGIDCSGFSGILQKEVYGNQLPRMASEQYQSCYKINKEEMKEGDLVFFNTRGGVSHVGVYLSNNYFVHASSKEGVTISNLYEDYYLKTFISAGRIIGTINN